MNRIQEKIVKIIVNFLEGKASEEEINYLKVWKSASEENNRYYHQIKNIWEVSTLSSDLPSVSVESAYAKVKKRIGYRKNAWLYWQRIAAVLLLPLLIYQLYTYFDRRKEEEKIAFYEILVPEGSRSRIMLPDGSQVWLNSGSKIRYPSRFVLRNRQVYLCGEAYFEVQSDKSRPFIVNTPTLQVVATGTKFNVQALSERKVVEVALVSGVVSIKRFFNKREVIKLAQLKPNQTLTFDTSSYEVNIRDENAYKHIAWKDGKIVFRNDPLSYVIERLSYIYNVDIKITEGSLLNYRYRATFENESIDEILKLLKLTAPINYKEEKREVLPDNSFSKRKFIIYPVKRIINPQK